MKVFIDRPVATAMAFLALLATGVYSFLNTPIELAPKESYPMVDVVTSWYGVPPEVVQTQVTAPLEEACSTVKGMSATCALNGIFVSPFLLHGAGVVAALLVSGWAGLVLVWAGVAIGMTAILGLTYLVGNLVPIDPFAAFIAWVWFIAPTALGYGIGRGVSRLVARR